MKILLDLQACQGESGFRGIGSYSMSLALSIAKQAVVRGHHVNLLLNEHFPESILSIRKIFDGVVQQDDIFIFFTPGPTAKIDPTNAWRARAAELVREQYIASLAPDILHISSLFEGWGDDLVTSVHNIDNGIQTSVTLYDLIPMVLSNLYLVDPNYRNIYFRQIENLKRSDLLLAISEHSRREAIDLLGFDSKCVFNISGAVHDSFQKIIYTDKVKNKILKKYGINKPFLLYVPGGFDSRKNFERLFEAFAMLPINLRQKFQLVITSKLPIGMQENISSKASLADLGKDELLLTGFVTNHDLVALYNFCELFVFPSLHEGFGLPVLEAMACGAAVIGSNSTSIPDILGLEDALFDPLSAASISCLLQKSLTDENFKQTLRNHSLLQAKKFTWENSARLAIEAFELHFQSAGNSSSKIEVLLQSVDHCYQAVLAKLREDNLLPFPTSLDLELLNHAISVNHKNGNDKQLFVDVSTLIKIDSKTGIQRVVRSILLSLLKHPPFGYRVEPIYFESDRGYLYATVFSSGFMGNMNPIGLDMPIKFKAGDVFLGLDLTADLFPAVNSILKNMQKTGVKIHYVVYDLIPLLYSWHGPEIAKSFNSWINGLSLYADNLLCISEAVSAEVKQWFSQNTDKKQRKPKISHFHLGADIASSAPTNGLPNNAVEILEHLSINPSFLMVGTIEPRKGHKQALGAFEKLWAAGNLVNLVIVGKDGWDVDPLLAELKSHPELNKRLFWLNGISDEFLEQLYHSSAALIAVSRAEGFGLPLIEAAQHSLPIIARDIPVFREIAGKFAYYFSGLEDQDLAEAIKNWLALDAKNTAPQSTGVHWLTWQQSTQHLLVAIEV